MTDDARARLASGVGAFGRWLAQERELRGLERDEVARLTRLGAPVVDALESGDPARMPPPGYVLGYLRSYAAVVGLDADEVVLRWQEAAGEAPESPARRRRKLVPVLVAAAVLGVVAAMVLGALLK